MNIALTGDVMLGRLVDRSVIGDPQVSSARVWGDVLPSLLAADLRMINLECVISSGGQKWRPETKPFHFRAHPRAVEFLQAARIDCVTLANNHTLDYGPEALLECLELLEQAGIPHAGAGRNLDEALAPVVLEAPAGRVALIALTDNEPDWEATAARPGVNWVAYNARGLVEPYRTRIKTVLAEARQAAELVIVSAHVGPNWGKPAPAMRALAHDLLDLGADLYWGHSNHTPQGIELYHAKPILYSTGDFIDDYAVDPAERNDLSLLFVAEVDQNRVRSMTLHPVVIRHFGVWQAQGVEVTLLQKRIQDLSAEFGTSIRFDDRVGTLQVE